MSEKKHGDHTTGYGKPPKEHQFRKGQSGNPKGRPKKKNARSKANALPDIILAQMAEQVTITINGRNRSMTFKEAFGQMLVNKALQGHAPSIKYLLQLVLAAEQKRGILPPLPSNEELGKLTEEEVAATYKRIMEAC